MRLSVHEMAQRSGVSVRTLHYYDAIGLLRPGAVSEENGYRWYGEAELERLRQILFYRELDFSLAEIARLLRAGDCAGREALERQRELLELKRRRLERLLALLDDNLKGERMMEMKEFSTKELEESRAAYAAEAEQRWGQTDAWRESEEKAKGRTKEDWDALSEQSDAIFRRFAALRGGDPAGPEAHQTVRTWQEFLTAHCYRCTEEILAGLGRMYTQDDRFRKNLDRFGEGTAEFMSGAIAAYCRK